MVVVLTLGARHWIELPDWAAAAVIVLWVAKDAVLYPYVRRAYEAHGRGGAHDLIGARGTALDRLHPEREGYVRISSEMWKAELVPGAREVGPGERVRVTGVGGLTLQVEPESAAAPAALPTRTPGAAAGPGARRGSP